MKTEKGKLVQEINASGLEKNRLENVVESLTKQIADCKSNMRKIQSDCDKRIRGMKVKLGQSERDMVNKFSLKLDEKLKENHKALRI